MLEGQNLKQIAWIPRRNQTIFWSFAVRCDRPAICNYRKDGEDSTHYIWCLVCLQATTGSVPGQIQAGRHRCARCACACRYCYGAMVQMDVRLASRVSWRFVAECLVLARLATAFARKNRMGHRRDASRQWRDQGNCRYLGAVPDTNQGMRFFSTPSGKHQSASPSFFCNSFQSSPGPGSFLRPGAMCS